MEILRDYNGTMGQILGLKSASAGIIIHYHRLTYLSHRLGPRRPAGGGDMGGYYPVLLSWGTGWTKAEASTALNLGFPIDIILSL